jgi:SRSO17 transposase
MRSELIYKNINDLLINRKWKLEEKRTKYNIFVPPSDLQFSDTYKLFIYNKIDYSDFETEISKQLDIISQIYKEDFDELASIVIDDRQILSLHIENENIINGKPSILFLIC